MALNDVSFQLGQGGLGRPLPGEDYISGIIFYNTAYMTSGALPLASGPSGFVGTGKYIQQVFQVSDAEALGIVNDYSDETKATAALTITAVGSVGNITTISVAEPSPSGGKTFVVLCNYTQTSTDSSTTMAQGITTAINNGTLTHGYVAAYLTADSGAEGVVTITARQGLGSYLNSQALQISSSATAITTSPGSVTFSGGLSSKLAIYHYHISEYFRIINEVSGQGSLYVGFFPSPNQSGSWAEVATMQNFADGNLRQLAVYNDQATFSTSAVSGLQIAETALDNLHMPLSILYTANFVGLSGLSSLTDLSTLNSSKVSVVIGQDGAAQGWSLFQANAATTSITCLGATLGAVSAAAVSEDIAWVGKFNLSDGTELDTAAFADGTLYRSIANSELTQIDNQRYIFLRKFIGQTGTYFNDSHCAILQNSDYAYIENNRTIDKAKRGMYVSLLPALNSPLALNSDGTLADTTISYLETLGEQPLQQMQRDGDLSNFQVTIDATQNVLSTNIVKVNALLQPMGVARNIQVTIGFTTSIQ